MARGDYLPDESLGHRHGAAERVRGCVVRDCDQQPHCWLLRRLRRTGFVRTGGSDGEAAASLGHGDGTLAGTLDRYCVAPWKSAGKAGVSGNVTVGVVGLGYWGPNLARNFAALPQSELTWVCDGLEDQLAQAAARFPGVRTSTSLDELLADQLFDAVAVATPVLTHTELAGRVLEAGKHCFVEKPVAVSVAEAEGVVEAGAWQAAP